MAEDVLISRTEKPNSYEIGRTGKRLKLYFNLAEDLQQQIDALKKIGVFPED